MADETDMCPLCNRPLGRKREKHHLIPRLKGGRETVTLHPICHQKIHALFTEAQLARSYATIDALRAEPEIIKFVRWLRGKPADFHAPTRRARSKSR